MLNIASMSLYLSLAHNFFILGLIIGNRKITQNFHIVLRTVSQLPWIGGRAIIFTQAYEWLSMLYVIQMQKDQGLGEILYQIQNSPTFLKFKRNERIIRWIYYLFVISLYIIIEFCVGQMTYTRLEYGTRYEDINVLFEVFSLMPMAVLAISFAPLIWKLRQHHYLVYQKQGLQIIYFFAFEVANCLLTQIIQFLLWSATETDGKEQIYLTWIAIYIYSGYNTIL